MSANNSKWLLPAFPPKPQFAGITAVFTTRNFYKQHAPGSSSRVQNDSSDGGISPQAVCEVLGLDSAAFTSGVQVHEKKVVRVTEREKGRGALDYYEGIPDTDGLVTDVPGVPIGVFTADCVPVFLYDPARPAVGIVHAGWRSTVRSIVECALAVMFEKFRSQPENLYAAIGPSIGQCCYEVGPDVYEQFHAAFVYADFLFAETGAGTWHLDLWEANRRQLLTCGVKDDRIVAHCICSACRSDQFSSARRLGPRAGRTLSLIALHNRPKKL